MKKMDNVPFPPSKSSKVNYMWKDIQRRAKIYQIPIPKIPAPYPLKYFDEANLYALVALQEGWFVNYLENDCFCFVVRRNHIQSLIFKYLIFKG